jgi:hypothetical protein
MNKMGGSKIAALLLKAAQQPTNTTDYIRSGPFRTSAPTSAALTPRQSSAMLACVSGTVDRSDVSLSLCRRTSAPACEVKRGPVAAPTFNRAQTRDQRMRRAAYQ